MGRKRNPIPTYLLHKTSGQARVKIDGKDIYLGVYGSEESKRAYERLVAELRVGTVPTSTTGLTVAELILRFWSHATNHYRTPDGKPTSEVSNFKDALRPVVDLYEDVPATEFGPLALKAVRQKMIEAGITRRSINARVGRIRRVWRWGVSEELIPAAVFEALRSVQGLQKGRTTAIEKPPVVAVPDADVERTLPHLVPAIRAMVQVQRLTGMRPGEVCGLQVIELDQSGDVWLYIPSKHKTAHRGKVRTVAIGPRAKKLLSPFLINLSGLDYVFSPAREEAARHAVRAANRKTPRPPSQLCRRLKHPKQKPGERYKRSSYEHAISTACERAGVPGWAPNQLRHTFATSVRKLYGLEAAGAGLGHTKMSATEVYAARDSNLAAKVAREIG